MAGGLHRHTSRVKFFPLFLLSFLCVFSASCSSSSVRKVVPLDQFRRVYVERRLNENNHLDEFFVAELQRLGHEASSGPLTMMPDKTDALLTYDAHWEWDFQTYLIELSCEVHTVHPRKKLADASYRQPTPKPKSPEKVVREIVDRLFAK